MSARRMRGLTVISVVFIALFVCIVLLLSGLRHSSREIKLPEQKITDTTPNTHVNNDEYVLGRVTVTPATVQNVISTLARPYSYTRDISVTIFGDGTESSTKINTTVLGDITSLRISTETYTKRIIVTPEDVYIWYGEDEAVKLTNAEHSLKTADEYQMMLTYTDILTLDKRNIISAGYDEESGCIYVEYKSSRLGHITKCYVSIELGLIVRAEEYEMGELVYTMSAGECDAGEVDLNAFDLPDGSTVIDPL